ncbi:MAG: Ig-like domain-containing protein [Terracidiphilus sp.]
MDVRFWGGRGVRLELAAGLSLALGVPALALATETPRSLATVTALNTETHDANGRTDTTLTVNVTGADGQPAQGIVVFADQGKPVAGIALDSNGHATETLALPPGSHSLTATYQGDTAHAASVSQGTPVRAVTGTAPDFSISIAPASLSLKQGQSGAAVASVTPINASSLTAPMFVTLSCSGLPDQSSCSFTPENIEILPNATAPVTSALNLATSAQGQIRKAELPQGNAGRVSWAILLPGLLGLAGLGFGARRKRWLKRVALLGLVGLVGVLGATACSPLYNFRNHGPSVNLPTPAGTYTLLVTAQSSNGVTATTHSITLALTVQ